jgi:hypothetical protein
VDWTEGFIEIDPSQFTDLCAKFPALALATSLFRVSHFKIAAKRVSKLDLPGSLAFHL